MPQYVCAALEKLNHKKPTKPQDAPHPWVAKQYGKKSHITEPDLTPLLLDH